MTNLPKVVASSVIRSAHQGESHGGVYIVDLDTGGYEQVIDWDDSNINWEGRGGERGLRGIAFSHCKTYIAGSSQILVYDKDFNSLGSHRNKYLDQCHETYISGNTLFIASTGFDSVIEFDLVSERFVKGYCLRRFDDSSSVFELDPVTRSLTEKSPSKSPNGKGGLGRRLKQMMHSLRDPMEFSVFDPNCDDGPLPADKYHVNNVYFAEGVLYVSGTGFNSLLGIKDDCMQSFARIPNGTHNVRPFSDGVIFNDTAANRVAYFDRKNRLIEQFAISPYDEDDLLMSDLPKDYARQGFGRGLCLTDTGLIVGGSSPATISVYTLGSQRPLKSINLTMDVRNSIHGLELWPYE
jgi:hypothetical protein